MNRDSPAPERTPRLLSSPLTTMIRSSHDFRRVACMCGVLLAGLAPLAAQRMRIGSSNPTGASLTPARTDALFAAGDTKSGVELWVSQGTPASTRQLIDVYPGALSSYPTEITRRSARNGNTWFVARTRTRTAELGRELHFYPGLPGSTAGGWVADIAPGATGSNPNQLTLVGDRLFFTAADKTGRELWTSDGTLAGTVQVRDIEPGAPSSYPFGLTSYRGMLVFAATTKAGTELWISKGTAATTVMIADIHPRGSSTPSKFAEFGGRLYFTATSEKGGRELWSTDGTSAGTVQVADMVRGVGSSDPSQLVAGPKALAFTAWTPTTGRQLFVFDGTTIVQKTKLAQGASIAALTAVGDEFWFRARTPLNGAELWRCTPTSVGMVHDLRPGALGSFPANLMPFGKGVLFRADDGVTGAEVWRSDGTTAALVRDIRPGPCASRPAEFAPILISTRTQYLFAAKGDHDGIELWSTTGATASQVRDIDPANVLPGLHWDDESGGIRIEVKDAVPNRPGILIIATRVGQPLSFPFLRGLVTVDIFGPTVLVPFRLDRLGEFTLQIPRVPFSQRSTSLVSQAVTETAAGLDASAPGSCNQGVLDLDPPPTSPNGPKVQGRICLDDESGEYMITAERIDVRPVPAYIGIYQKAPGGDLDFLMSYPIAPGDLIEDSGQIEILLPLDPSDSPGRHLEMHLFMQEPGPGSDSPASLVTTSYC